MIEILQPRYVTLHGYDIPADFFCGSIQLGLSPSCDEDERSLRDETLGGGEPDSAASSSDHRDFTF
jgi:hypothetical protein